MLFKSIVPNKAAFIDYDFVHADGVQVVNQMFWDDTLLLLILLCFLLFQLQVFVFCDFIYILKSILNPECHQWGMRDDSLKLLKVKWTVNSN